MIFFILSSFILLASSMSKKDDTESIPFAYTVYVNVCPHLSPSVAVVSVEVPFDSGMGRSGLALQKRAAALHPVLHRL